MTRFRLLAFVAVLFGIGFAAALLFKPSWDESGTGTPLIGGPFTLMDGARHEVTDRDFRGKLMLVFFGYTNCPDVCPTELQTMARTLDKLGAKGEKIAPIFISVDPERDTPEALANYVKSISPRIVGLTGTPEQVAAAAKAYRVFYRVPDRKPGATDYAVDHSAFVYLMDGQGKYLTHFSFETPAETMAATIEKYLGATETS
jgi:protein SCO1/2